MNIITIDPSLSCTAMVINDKKFIYTTHDTAKTKTGKLKNWFELCKDLITYRFHDNINEDDHVLSEVLKFKLFLDLTNNIKTDILANIDIKNPITVAIEGYSHSSNAGPLIDLVTFGTLLRWNVMTLNDNVNMIIIPPTQLKLKAAQLTYPPIEKGVKVKKYEWRNNEGVSGGGFTKIDMCKALLENDNLTCEWVAMLRDNKEDILNLKNIPKPIEDMNDAKLLYEILLKK